MNREVLESQWTQIRVMLRDKFPNLTEEDIRQINGRYDQLVAKLQQKYGYSREEAEERIRNWNFDRFASAQPGRMGRDEDRIRREDEGIKREDTSLLKWILGLGIPLLLAFYLLSQMGTQDTTRTTTPTPTTNQQVTTTQSDRTIVDGLRDAFAANRTFADDARNVQVSANNGIVTLTGNVPDSATHDYFIDTAKNFSGVRQVIDNLQVR